MTQITSTGEFPPIFPPGLHSCSLADLRQICVNPFPQSRTRAPIMDGLDTVITHLHNHGIHTDVWVNGSFLTHKEHPNDSDIVVKVDATILDNGTEEQRQTLEWINSDLKTDHLCDSFIMPIYPDGDPLQVLNDYHIAYWFRQFGFSRGVEYKGIAVINSGVSI